MNIQYLFKLINFILLLILITSLKYYFVYITICFLCVYLFIRMFIVLKLFFINKILYSLLNIYLKLFRGKFYNLLKFCFDTYQQNILKFFFHYEFI